MTALFPWLLPVFLFLVWSLWVVACAAQAQAEDLRRGAPKDARRGVSVLPGIPLFPLLFWAAMVLINKWFLPWGSILVGGLHLAFAFALIATIIREIRFCRLHDARQQQ